MKKIILYVIGLIAILWVAMFLADTKILVWEEFSIDECQKENENRFSKWKQSGVVETTKKLSQAELDALPAKQQLDYLRKKQGPLPKNCGEGYWDCTYFTGRRLIQKQFYSQADSCPNLL